ncbi:MAG: YsnF/AvaK domain-containing protein [Pseudomonadota bacterium]
MQHHKASSKTDNPSVTIPVAREELEVSKNVVETGIVRVKKVVREHEELIEQPLLHTAVKVERVTINRVIEQPVTAHYEGDVLVIPVLEEVLVVQKQLVLKEELRISKSTVETQSSQRVTLRNEEVFVEREKDFKNGS